MTEPAEPIEPVDWKTRLEVSTSAWRYRRARLDAFRADRARRRRYGLRVRYQQKVARREASTSEGA